MDALALLQELQEVGCELRPEGDRLRVRAPAGVLTDELRSLIREHKAALLGLLSGGEAGQAEPRRDALAPPDEGRGLTPGARVPSLVPGCPERGVVVATGFRSGRHGPFAAVRFDDGLLAFVAEDLLLPEAEAMKNDPG